MVDDHHRRSTLAGGLAAGRPQEDLFDQKLRYVVRIKAAHCFSESVLVGPRSLLRPEKQSMRV
jgi:hypothetical protein